MKTTKKTAAQAWRDHKKEMRDNPTEEELARMEQKREDIYFGRYMDPEMGDDNAD